MPICSIVAGLNGADTERLSTVVALLKREEQSIIQKMRKRYTIYSYFRTWESSRLGYAL